nr:HAD family hydrolase [Nocardiopsis ansamitocini]
MNTTFPPTGVQHIVWDWNGTLLDDNHANLAAVNRICADFGRAPIDLDFWRSSFRRPLIPCYEELIGRAFREGEWERVNTMYDRFYLEHLESCELAEGVVDTLLAWSTGGRTQSLLSMASHDHLVPLIDQRGLTVHFTRVDGRRYDTEGDSKAAHLIEHLVAQDIDPATTVLIGDIDDDARAAQEAGAHSVLVATGLMTRERLEATGSPVASSVAQAVRLLGG